jgi:hypothetical protein
MPVCQTGTREPTRMGIAIVGLIVIIVIVIIVLV